MISNNNFNYQIMFLSSTIIAVGIGWLIIFIMRKKGINIYKNNRLLKIGLIVFPIILIPAIEPLPTVSGKIKAATMGILAVILTYFAVDRGSNIFRRTTGYESKWAKEERELHEKEEKEKISKKRNDVE